MPFGKFPQVMFPGFGPYRRDWLCAAKIELFGQVAILDVLKAAFDESGDMNVRKSGGPKNAPGQPNGIAAGNYDP